MQRIEKHVLVDAPGAAIFSFVNDPYNLLRLFPNLIEITNVTRFSNGGRDFQCTFKMAGVRILFTAECTEHIVNQRIDYRVSGGLHGTMCWRFETVDETTQVTFILEYEVPHPLLKRHTESEIARQNAQDIQQLLFNLKTNVESQTHISE
jgi:ribosome-associated toxin RatA of RatAB toxin-antitoxin module